MKAISMCWLKILCRLHSYWPKRSKTPAEWEYLDRLNAAWKEDKDGCRARLESKWKPYGFFGTALMGDCDPDYPEEPEEKPAESEKSAEPEKFQVPETGEEIRAERWRLYNLLPERSLTREEHDYLKRLNAAWKEDKDGYRAKLESKLKPYGYCGPEEPEEKPAEPEKPEKQPEPEKFQVPETGEEIQAERWRLYSLLHKRSLTPEERDYLNRLNDAWKEDKDGCRARQESESSPYGFFGTALMGDCDPDYLEEPEEKPAEPEKQPEKMSQLQDILAVNAARRLAGRKDRKPTLSGKKREPLPLEEDIIYTVETPEGDLLSLTPTQLNRYAQKLKSEEEQKKTKD